MRVSDAERNSLADLLAQHYGDGRLDDAEFKERMDRAMSAKTRSDMYGLTADLPRLGPDAAPVATSRHRHMPVRGVIVPILGVILAIGFVNWSLQSAFFFAPNVPWLLIAIVGVLIWRRRSWHTWHRHDHQHSSSAPPPFG
jgi:hypothetical protein